MIDWKKFKYNKKTKTMSDTNIDAKVTDSTILGMKKENPLTTFIIFGAVIFGGAFLSSFANQPASVPAPKVNAEAQIEKKCEDYSKCDPNKLFEIRDELKSEKEKNTKAKEVLDAETQKAKTNLENIDAQLQKVDEAITNKLK